MNEHLAQLQIFNLIQSKQPLPWEKLLTLMAGLGETNRELIFQQTNALIDTEKVAVYKTGKNPVYCLPGAVKKLDALKNQKPPSVSMTRERFDQMTPQEKMDFVNAGGQVNG